MSDDELNSYLDRDLDEGSTSKLGSDVDAGDDVSAEPSIAEVDAFLSEVIYPADRDELVAAAEELEADERILLVLRDLPDEIYRSELHVNDALGEREPKE